MKETDDKITVYTIVLYFDYGSRNADVHGAGAVAFTDSYEEAQNLLRLEAEKEKQYVISSQMKLKLPKQMTMSQYFTVMVTEMVEIIHMFISAKAIFLVIRKLFNQGKEK